MLYSNPEITKYFNEETIHVLDYQLEYDRGLPDAHKFPEYQNKVRMGSLEVIGNSTKFSINKDEFGYDEKNWY